MVEIGTIGFLVNRDENGSGVAVRTKMTLEDLTNSEISQLISEMELAKVMLLKELSQKMRRMNLGN